MAAAFAVSVQTEAAMHRHAPGAEATVAGGYRNQHHSFDNRRKLKARTRGQQPRRWKAQRRARAA
jgi:hypothetical protein